MPMFFIHSASPACFLSSNSFTKSHGNTSLSKPITFRTYNVLRLQCHLSQSATVPIYIKTFQSFRAWKQRYDVIAWFQKKYLLETDNILTATDFFCPWYGNTRVIFFEKIRYTQNDLKQDGVSSTEMVRISGHRLLGEGVSSCMPV